MIANLHKKSVTQLIEIEADVDAELAEAKQSLKDSGYEQEHPAWDIIWERTKDHLRVKEFLGKR